MITIKALNSFCGTVSMYAGEVRSFNDDEVANLIKDGLVVEVKSAKVTKKIKKNADNAEQVM